MQGTHFLDDLLGVLTRLTRLRLEADLVKERVEDILGPYRQQL